MVGFQVVYASLSGYNREVSSLVRSCKSLHGSLLLPLLIDFETFIGHYYRIIAFPQVLDKQKAFQRWCYFTLVMILEEFFGKNSLEASSLWSDLETLGHPSGVVMIPDFKTREFE